MFLHVCGVFGFVFFLSISKRPILIHLCLFLSLKQFISSINSNFLFRTFLSRTSTRRVVRMIIIVFQLIERILLLRVYSAILVAASFFSRFRSVPSNTTVFRALNLEISYVWLSLHASRPLVCTIDLTPGVMRVLLF